MPLIYPWVIADDFIYDEFTGGWLYFGEPAEGPEQIETFGRVGSSAVTEESIAYAVTPASGSVAITESSRSEVITR